MVLRKAPWKKPVRAQSIARCAPSGLPKGVGVISSPLYGLDEGQFLTSNVKGEIPRLFIVSQSCQVIRQLVRWDLHRLGRCSRLHSIKRKISRY